MGPPEDIRSWMEVLKSWNKGDPKDREKMKYLIQERLDGWLYWCHLRTLYPTNPQASRDLPKCKSYLHHQRPRIVGKEPGTILNSGSDVVLTSRSTPPARYATFPGLYRSSVYSMREIVP